MWAACGPVRLYRLCFTRTNQTCLFIYLLFLFIAFLGVFADGPGAYLFHGVFEQPYVFHVMDHALCLSSSKQKSCDKHVKRGGVAKSTAHDTSALSSSVLVVVAYWIALIAQA